MNFGIKELGKYYKVFSDFIYKHSKLAIISIFITLSAFFSLEFYYIKIWDYLVRIMDAQFFFHGGTYFEIPRAILESVIIGLYGFFMGPFAIYGFIITATVIFFFAVYDFSKAFKVKMLLVLLILMNPYIIFYTMQAGSELMVFFLPNSICSGNKTRKGILCRPFLCSCFPFKILCYLFLNTRIILNKQRPEKKLGKNTCIHRIRPTFYLPVFCI